MTIDEPSDLVLRPRGRGLADNGIAVERIEIPIFQRDYAQGRDTDPVRRIRADFLDVLRSALAARRTDTRWLGLRLRRGRRAERCDRSTVSSASPRCSCCTGTSPLAPATWPRSTGGSASPTPPGRAPGCSAKAWSSTRSPGGEAAPSDWIQDQPWYLFLWRHDPTIQSMLVMLDAIHERFARRRRHDRMGTARPTRQPADLVPPPPAVRPGPAART